MQTGGSMQEKTKDAQAGEERVAGMDSIRFIAALWVAFYHLGFSSTFSITERVSLEQKILGARRGLFVLWSCRGHCFFS